MNRYPVNTVRVTITWKSGCKVRYTDYPLADLTELLALYTPEISGIRKITVKEN
jgi:hypothetical protein